MKKLLLYIGVLLIICSCSENGKGQIDENDLITFHDIEVHAVCVENWDVNGDLEISYKEASLALITDEFTNNDRIIAFPEFVYFKRNTAVYKNAFKGCSNLREIILGENITSIGEYAFQDCSKLSSIILPPSVKSICDYAFDGCEALKEVQVPNNVDVIGRNGFSRCIALELATLPDSLLEINERVFWGCKSLTELRLPDCVAVIKEAAFMGTGLTSITIPQCVTCIESFSFANCDSLIKVYALGNNPPLIADVFEECASLEVIFVPQESIDRYKNDWKAYKKYIAPYNSQEKVLLVDEECLFVNSSDTIIEIGIKTNSEYVVSTSNPKWISIKKSTRTMLSEDICTVSISENIISEKRCGEVLFTSSDNTEIADTLFIIQDSKLMRNGSFSSPYSVGEALTLRRGREVWVAGYIVGSVKGSMANGCNFTSEATTSSNILLADTFPTGAEYDYLYCLPVELPNGSAERDALNLYDNPENYHRKVSVQGNLTLYYSVVGMNQIADFSFGEEDDDNGNDNENEEDNKGDDETKEDPIPENSKDYPLSITEGIRLQSEDEYNQAWVSGYIVGFARGNNLVSYLDSTATGLTTKARGNVVLADSVGESDNTRIIVVELPKGYIRDDVNLYDNPQNLHKKLTVIGRMIPYYDMPGCRETLGTENRNRYVLE